MGTPPSGFRTTSLIVSALLLAALAAAIALAIFDNPRSAYPPLAAAPTAGQGAISTTSPNLTDTPDAQAAELVATDSATDSATPEVDSAVSDAAETEPADPEPVDVETGAATETATSPPPTPAPTATEGDATEPSVNPGGAPGGVRLGEQRRVEPAGFAFQPVTGYSLEFAGESVTLSAREDGDAAGALMLLRADLADALVGDAGTDLDGAFASIIESMSARQLVQSGETEDVMIGGEIGQAVDIADAAGDSELAGRIAVARPDAERLFLAVAFAPGATWDAAARNDFDAVLSSVEFFPAVVTPAPELADATPPSIAVDIAAGETPVADGTPETVAAGEPAAEDATATPPPDAPFGPESEWRVASNGNFANQVAPLSETVWTATDGGVVAWDRDAGSHAKFTTLDGLSSNRAAAAENCPLPGLGMLFATNSGLQVYDTQGGDWKTLDSAGSPMSYDDIAALYCDADEGFLIAAYARHGLDIFDADTGEWTLVDENDGLETGIIRKIAVTAPQTIWIASQLGLTRYVDGESTLFNTENSPMTANGVTALASDGVGAVWLATAGDLYRTDGENWQVFNASTATGTDFPNGSITGLAVAADGTVWVGSDQTQVCRFDPATGGCVEFFSNEEGMAIAPLTSLRLDEEGIVYYTTAGAGVSAYDGAQWSLYFVEDEPIASNRIRSMASMDDGTVWVATQSGVSQIGLDIGAPLRFFTAADSPLLSQDVRIVQPISDTSAWFGTAGGANAYDDPNWQSYTEADGLAGADVRALAVDSQSRNWIGSTTGLSIWTGNGFFNLTTENGLPSDNISTLLSVDDLVWIGTDTGLLRFQDNQLQVFNTGNINLPSDVITALALDADGSLLIGTEAGLARFRDSRIVAVPDIPSAPVRSIAAGNDGEVWVSAGTGELYHFDGAEWMPVPNLGPLPSKSISALFLDENGDLWMGTDEGGLAVVTP